ncbi:Na/Pi cotransporter family protein [bacterium]|nr:Na/Pi cotransporter family protein [bacterium]
MESFNLFCILNLLGGLAFFLYGMHIMSDSLEKIAGGKLEKILKSITSNKYKGLLLGLGVTAVIQSSSAVTVMLVGLVNSGLMKLSQAIGVIMGSNIGTTATAWILSLVGIQADNSWIALFKPDSLTPIMAFIGMLIFFIAKSNKNKNIGSVLLGFAVLMFGMIMMGTSMTPLSNSPRFAQLLTLFNNPFFGIFIGALLTAIIQSSSASVGMLQALALKVDISCGAALPIIMGQNIGTCITAIISSIGVNSNARKVAVVHLSFNIIGTVIFLVAFLIGNTFFNIEYLAQVASPAKIAILHSIFNIGTTILLFPFVKQLEKLADFIIKEETNEKAIVLDERLLLSPELALIEANQKLIEMTDLVKSNLIYSTKLLKNYDTKRALIIAKNEQIINNYENKLKSYLIKVSNKELSEEMSSDIARLLLTINDFKQIQNIATNIFKIAEQKFSNRIDFSNELIEDLRIIVKSTRAMIRATQGALTDSNIKLAQDVEIYKQNIEDLIFKARSKHIQNVQYEKLPMEFDYMILNLFTDLDRTTEHCMNVSWMILKKEKDKSLTDFVYAW